MPEINDFRSKLVDTYRINISDDDYERLVNTMDIYGIGNANCKIDLQSDLGNLLNNLILFNRFKFNRMHCHITHEEILYELRPIMHASYFNAEISYPKRVHINKNKDTQIDKVKDEANIILIRTTEIDVAREATYDEKFTLVVYNPNLDVRGGIMFEPISK